MSLIKTNQENLCAQSSDPGPLHAISQFSGRDIDLNLDAGITLEEHPSLPNMLKATIQIKNNPDDGRVTTITLKIPLEYDFKLFGDTPEKAMARCLKKAALTAMAVKLAAHRAVSNGIRPDQTGSSTDGHKRVRNLFSAGTRLEANFKKPSWITRNSDDGKWKLNPERLSNFMSGSEKKVTRDLTLSLSKPDDGISKATLRKFNNEGDAVLAQQHRDGGALDRICYQLACKMFSLQGLATANTQENNPTVNSQQINVLPQDLWHAEPQQAIEVISAFAAFDKDVQKSSNEVTSRLAELENKLNAYEERLFAELDDGDLPVFDNIKDLIKNMKDQQNGILEAGRLELNSLKNDCIRAARNLQAADSFTNPQELGLTEDFTQLYKQARANFDNKLNELKQTVGLRPTQSVTSDSKTGKTVELDSQHVNHALSAGRLEEKLYAAEALLGAGLQAKRYNLDSFADKLGMVRNSIKKHIESLKDLAKAQELNNKLHDNPDNSADNIKEAVGFLKADLVEPFDLGEVKNLLQNRILKLSSDNKDILTQIAPATLDELKSQLQLLEKRALELGDFMIAMTKPAYKNNPIATVVEQIKILAPESLALKLEEYLTTYEAREPSVARLERNPYRMDLDDTNALDDIKPNKSELFEDDQSYMEEANKDKASEWLWQQLEPTLGACIKLFEPKGQG